jgi:MFS family permease
MAVRADIAAEPQLPILAPLRHPVFAAIWYASIFSSIGTQIQQVGAAWLMTSLGQTAEMVALVTAVSTLPILLFSLPSGALSDVLERRLVLLGAQLLMFGASATLAILAYAGLITPYLLLVLTFLVGAGAAIMAPAWQSMLGEIVPREEVPLAVALNSMAFNIARTLGPAAGGLIVAFAGAQVNFTLNALSYLALIAILIAWRPAKQQRSAPAEAVLPAMRDGILYALHATAVRRVLVRAMCFGFCSSIVVSLMPLVARDLLGRGATIFGLLMGCMGIGAVIGAAALGILRRHYSTEALIRLSIMVTTSALLVIGLSRWTPLTCIALFVIGGGMVLGLSSFNISVQMSVPRWVSGRALALYQMFTFGGMTGGAWLWGYVGEILGIGDAYLISAFTLAATLLLAWWMPLREVRPSEVTAAPDDERAMPPGQPPGTELVVVVRYRIASAHVGDFLALITARQRIRRRNGARHVTALQDATDPECWVERFQVRTWADHRRQLARRTLEAKNLDDMLRRLHDGAGPPEISYYFEKRDR